jgi:hypothetical protein
MDEADWVGCTDPQKMLEFVAGRISARKLRLFAVACCRRVWAALSAPSRDYVLLAERVADGRAGERELLSVAWDRAEEARDGQQGPALYHAADVACAAGSPTAGVAAARASASVVEALAGRGLVRPSGAPTRPAEQVALAQLLRDVFNPFARLADGPDWLTREVRALAEGIYEWGAFDGLPILADALEEAGCPDRALVDHLRSPGPHVRGCHVLDWLRGQP